MMVPYNLGRQRRPELHLIRLDPTSHAPLHSTRRPAPRTRLRAHPLARPAAPVMLHPPPAHPLLHTPRLLSTPLRLQLPPAAPARSLAPQNVIPHLPLRRCVTWLRLPGPRSRVPGRPAPARCRPRSPGRAARSRWPLDCGCFSRKVLALRSRRPSRALSRSRAGRTCPPAPASRWRSLRRLLPALSEADRRLRALPPPSLPLPAARAPAPPRWWRR